MIPKISDLRTLTEPTAANKAVFEARVGNRIKKAAKAGHTEVKVTGLKEYPATRSKLLAEGYTLTLWRDTDGTFTVSWS